MQVKPLIGDGFTGVDVVIDVTGDVIVIIDEVPTVVTPTTVDPTSTDPTTPIITYIPLTTGGDWHLELPTCDEPTIMAGYPPEDLGTVTIAGPSEVELFPSGGVPTVENIGTTPCGQILQKITTKTQTQRSVPGQPKFVFYPSGFEVGAPPDGNITFMGPWAPSPYYYTSYLSTYAEAADEAYTEFYGLHPSEGYSGGEVMTKRAPSPTAYVWYDGEFGSVRRNSLNLLGAYTVTLYYLDEHTEVTYNLI